MATNFPTSLDNLTNPAGSDPVNNPSHASQHANLNDAIEVLETKVGINNSADTTSLDYRVKSLETNPTYTNEMAQDAVAAALAAGTHTNITINYNDTGNSISISAAAGYTNEEAVDAVAAALTAGSGISISYNDAANTITISVDSTIATKTYVDTAVSNLGSTAASTYVPVSEVGQADGIATLDATGKVPDTQIPAGIARDSEVTSAISTAVNNLINSAPGTLDTLGEIAAALAADESAAAALTTVVNGKVSKAGGDVITSSLPSVVGLTIKGATSQTANLQQWQDSSGTVLNGVSAIGQSFIQTTTPITASAVSQAITAVSFTSTTATYTFSATVQTISVGEYVTVFGITPSGYNGTYKVTAVATVSAGTSYSFTVANITNDTVTVGTGYFFPSASVSISTQNKAHTGLIIKAVSGQTAATMEIQNSAGNPVTWWDSAGGMTASQAVVSTLYSGGFMNTGTLGYFNATTFSPSVRPIVVRGATSQTANLQEWQDSAGTVYAFISPFGQLSIGQSPTIYSNARISINTVATTVVGQVIRGVASQTANLQEWQNSAGTVLAKVDSTGAMFTITPADSTNTTQVATTAYVKSNIANLVSSAPATLDTLNELATALGNDANFSTTITNSLAAKAPLASPTFTGAPLAPTASSGTNTTQIATTAFVKTAIDTSVQPGAVYQTSAPSSPAVGQIWIDSDEDVTTFDPNIIRRKAITATAGQTVFTADLPFIDGFEQIFMNGLLLVKTTDYTTSGGNTVTLTSAAAASDVIEIVSVTGANSVNTYTQAEVNALLAANTSVAPLSISANTTLVAKKRYFVTSASALTLTLPASPALNDEIQIVDASGNASTYNITVARNANKINGGLNNLIIDTNGGWYTLLYTGATYGWKVG